MFLQNPFLSLSWILDMWWELACLGSVQKLHKVTEGIFLYKLSCDIDKSA
jgi:hypothetical protein